jgi:hypothetical protein
VLPHLSPDQAWTEIRVRYWFRNNYAGATDRPPRPKPVGPTREDWRQFAEEWHAKFREVEGRLDAFVGRVEAFEETIQARMQQFESLQTELADARRAVAAQL